jgi:hypothetical protein
MSSKSVLFKFDLDEDIVTVFSALRPDQDKITTCKKLQVPSGILPEDYVPRVMS